MRLVSNPLWIIAFLTLALAPVSAVRADEPLPEYKVKAAIIYKVAKFISWPGKSFASRDDSMRLCIAGEDPFGDVIDSLNGQSVHGHSLEVVRVSDEDLETRGCHIVYVGADSQAIEILGRDGFDPVLTVGDSRDFAADGGVLGLRTENNRVKFEVNLDVAKASELEISASLLQLATIVEAKGSGNAFVH